VLQRDLKKTLSLGKYYSTSNFAKHLLENGLSYSKGLHFNNKKPCGHGQKFYSYKETVKTIN
jgi:hypothetical protein